MALRTELQLVYDLVLVQEQVFRCVTHFPWLLEVLGWKDSTSCLKSRENLVSGLCVWTADCNVFLEVLLPPAYYTCSVLYNTIHITYLCSARARLREKI